MLRVRLAVISAVVAAVCLAAACGPAGGQLFESQHRAAEAMKLTPEEQATLDRLKALGALPDGPWRFHAGDVAHGESPALDDSGWAEVKAKSTAGHEAVWYRRRITIPQTLDGYDLTGTDVSFRFDAYANGPMPEILYFNGRRVAMGDDLEAVELFHDVKPGDSVLVAVKLLPTVDTKDFDHVDLKVSFAASRPNPEDLRVELVSAATLLPSLAAGNAADRAMLTESLGEVDLAALQAANQGAFDASLKKAQGTLEGLRPLLRTVNYNLTGNSHIDAAWLWPWTETVDTVKRTFGTAVQLMSEYPTYTYTQSAAVYSQWMADKYPELNAQIAEKVKEGRWELVGGMWLEPDLNMPDGESQVRQILIGQATFQKLYGTTTRIGWNPDSFGYNWQLPQIYKRSGIDYFVTQKLAWNDTNKLPLKLFWWEAPDGSKVLTYFPHDYANDDVDPVRLAKDMASARAFSPGLNDMMDLFGVGDHGGGPTRGMLDQGLHWMEPGKVIPAEEFGTAQPYFTRVEGEIAPESPVWDYKTLAAGKTGLPAPAAGEISIPTWKDELYLEYHRGVFTTQANHKRNMRDAEEWVMDAERFAALAWLDGQAYPADKLTDAWKLVLFNQFHDLAAGSGLGLIYKEAQKDYDRVKLDTDAVSAESLATVAARVDTRVKAGVPVLVVNPLGWARTETVEMTVQLPDGPADQAFVRDDRDRVLASEVVSHDAATHTMKLRVRVEDVPAMGYVLVYVMGGEHAFPTDLVEGKDALTLENAALRVRIDPATGCVSSLYDKKAGFETLAAGACGNELQAFVDEPKNYDAWNIDPGTLDETPALLHGVDSVERTENGPFEQTVTVKRHWQNSTFVQAYTLRAGSDEVLVTNDIGWHETHVLLKAAFPLAATSPEATYEIPYGTIQRATTRSNSFEKARFEVPALRWADEGDGAHGFSLINNSKYGYDGVGNLLRLTLLRSPTWPDPVADQGEHRFSYVLYPHAGTWQAAGTVEHGYDANYALQAMQVAPHEGTLPQRHSFFSVDAPNVVITAVKKAEDGSGVVVRFYEWAGKGGTVGLTVPAGAAGATVTNLMEKPEGAALAVTGDKVEVPVSPFEIQTVLVKYAPKTE